MAKAWLMAEKARRCLRTVFFMATMTASLLVSSLPVLGALADVLVPSALVSSFTCLTCYGVAEHLRRYAFKSSLIDIPLVSLVRSLIIICVYSLCDGPALSQGPYLGTVTLCSFASILFLSVKACVFTVDSELTSISRQKLHLKKSWGIPVLFLSSVIFALAHIIVAYRTSYRAKRKLLYHRVDPEAVFPCKNGYKAPRSPTPSTGKIPKSEGEIRQTPSWTSLDREEFPLRLLTDLNSSFITIHGLMVHYKLSLPGSLPHSLSLTNIHEHSSGRKTLEMAVRRLKLDKQVSNVASQTRYHHLHRSYSIQFEKSSLYDTLLDGYPTSPVLSEHIPAFSLDDMSQKNDMNKLNSRTFEQDSEGNGHFGIVLVHGFGGGVFSWRHVMGELSQQLGVVVAAFDRPGWGLTFRPHRKDWEERQLPNPYKLESQVIVYASNGESSVEYCLMQVNLLLSFCSEMGFSSVVLVGHDDGGLLALKAAERVQASINSFNVAIKGVVLLNVSLSRELIPAFARMLLHTSLGRKHLVRPLLRTEITEVISRHAWYDSSKLTTEVLGLYKAPLCVERWDDSLHEISRLSYEMVLSQKNASSLLKSVEELPVLVVAGAEDALVPLRSSQALASKLVNSRLVAISGCGHLPHEECPKTLLAAISPFITKLIPKPDS